MKFKNVPMLLPKSLLVTEVPTCALIFVEFLLAGVPLLLHIPG